MKNNKIYIIAAVFLLAGLCVIGAIAASVGFDPKKLSTVSYMEKEYTAEYPVTDLVISDSNTDVELEPYDGGTIKLEYVETDRETYTITLSGKTLTVEKHTANAWVNIFNFDFSFKARAMKVYIPANLMVSLRARTSNARIEAGRLEFSELELTSSNGKIVLSDISCKSDARLTTSNSAIKLTDASVLGNIDCSTSNGSITLSDIGANAVTADNSNGPISLDKITAERISADTSNGRIEIGGLAVARELRLKTSNASITGTLQGGLGDYNITSATSNGSNSLPDKSPGGDISLIVRTSNGSINLEFED